jgi:hypothetical protein
MHHPYSKRNGEARESFTEPQRQRPLASTPFDFVFKFIIVGDTGFGFVFKFDRHPLSDFVI